MGERWLDKGPFRVRIDDEVSYEGGNVDRAVIGPEDGGISIFLCRKQDPRDDDSNADREAVTHCWATKEDFLALAEGFGVMADRIRRGQT